MGHHLHIFIGSHAALAALAGNDEQARIFDISCGLSVLPVTLAWLNASNPPDLSLRGPTRS